jgi:hypothetical protein
MTFSKWLKEVDEEYESSFREKYKGKSILPHNAFDWHREAYFNYKIIESNKGLVWATWILAIATIILSILTLFIK